MRTGRLSTNVKISLILFLLGVCAVPAPLATAQSQTLTGWFTFIVADYQTESGLTSEMTYFLTEDSGERHELLIDVELMRPLGGPVTLSRKRVTVMGEWEEVGPDATEKFRVYSIELAPSPSTALPGRTVAPNLLPDEPPQPRAMLQAAQTDSHVRGSQAWVTILCRFADLTDITPYPVSHYEKLMGSSYPGLDHYWREVSYGNINLTGSMVVGWYNLPRSYPEYEEENMDGLEEDCSDAADADIFFPDFDGINFIFNFWDRSIYGGQYYLTKDGHQQLYGFTVTASELGRPGIHSALSHEMGHAFGLMHSSGPYDETYDSYWDAVSIGGCSYPGPEYGCIDPHTIAYHKDFLGWIPPARKYVAPPNSIRTITLERLAQPGPDGYLMAQIPIGNSSTDFYTVEARMFAGYDDAIPGEAVIIHKVDTTRGDRLAQVVDIDNNGDPNDGGAMWTPGEIFTDRANGVQVSVDAKHPTGYRVTIKTNPATFTSCIGFLLPTTSRHIFIRPGRDTGSVPVRAASGCNWSATSNTEWIRITSGGSGRGNGSVSYAVAANTNSTARTGTLTIGGWILTVTQAGVATPHILFEDDMEDGTNRGSGFPSAGGKTTTTSRGGVRAWEMDYSDLGSPVIDLPRVTSATLTFWHRYDFANGDAGVLQMSDGRSTWPVDSFTGTSTTWSQVVIDLTPYIGRSIQFVFIFSRTTGNASGWYVDDVAVFSPTPPLVLDPHRCRDYGPCSAGKGDCDPGQCAAGLVCSPDVGVQYGLPPYYDVCEATPTKILFEDDMENGPGGWVSSTSWSLTTASSRSGTHAWTYSIPQNYGAGKHDLYTPVIDLTGFTSATLTFWQRGDFPSDYAGFVGVCQYRVFEPDFCRLQAIIGYSGGSPYSWETSIDLSEFLGQRIRVGFRLEPHTDLPSFPDSAGSWTVDDVTVEVTVSSSDLDIPDPDYCQDYGPCNAGQGDCDPGQCQEGVVCVNDVGAQYGLPAHYDVCETPSGGGTGVPNPDLCRDYGPCGVGQGDCDPGQCGEGLVCVADVGPQYGLPAIYDVCEAPSGSPALTPDPDYCRDHGPCGVGQGDCDPGQCADGLVCAADVGPQYGLPAIYDVCEVPSG